MANIAIHGFGRIGRTALKATIQNALWIPSVISDVRDPAIFAALFEVDSNYGRWREPVSFDGRSLVVGDKAIAYINVSDSLPDWGALGVDCGRLHG